MVELLKDYLLSSKGLGTSNSPIVIESEAEDSPVEGFQEDKFTAFSSFILGREV